LNLKSSLKLLRPLHGTHGNAGAKTGKELMLYLLNAFPLNWSAESLEKLSAFVRRMGKIEPFFEGHVERVCFYALNFGKFIGLSERELRQLYLAAFFHDAGKVSLPPEILRKNGPLAPEEFKIIESHPTQGAKLCLMFGPLEEISSLVALHHEKLDGTGYPNGLTGKDIPLLARILAIIEIYDALRSERCYKGAFSLQKSLEILRAEVLAGHLDRELVYEFVRFGQSHVGHPEILKEDFFRAEKESATLSAVRAESDIATGSVESSGSEVQERPVTVLVAEDDPDQLEIIKTILSQNRYRVMVAADGEEAMKQLAQEPVDIALLDIMMPKMSGLEVCRKIRKDPRQANIYVIFLTALAGAEERVGGLELGANDYIIKPFYLPDFSARIRVGEKLIHERRNMEKRAAEDPLTGLYNQRMFEERLRHEFERAKRYGRPLSLMMIDIDDFKQVNDQYGHHWGDAVLREIARILKEKTRKSDILVRYGGDEFTLMLPEASIAVALQTADKLRTEIKAALFRPDSGPSFSVTVSVGVSSTLAGNYKDGAAFLHDADAALYRAKRKGKNRVESRVNDEDAAAS